MDQSYIARWIVRLDGYHMIIEHRMREKCQNAVTLSKKNGIRREIGATENGYWAGQSGENQGWNLIVRQRDKQITSLDVMVG